MQEDPFWVHKKYRFFDDLSK
jgi:hypothetical protein